MTARERVLCAFKHIEPDKVPRWCGASAEFWDKAKSELGLDDEGLNIRFGDDFRRVHARYGDAVSDPSLPPGWQSPFDIERAGLGWGQALNHPLAGIETVKEAVEYPWPDGSYVDSSQVGQEIDDVRRRAEAAGEEYAILGGDWSPFWHDVIELVGHEQLYYMMYDVPEVIEYLFEKSVDYYVEVNEKIFSAAAEDIDIFFMGNDFGSQNGPLLGTDLFERFVLPHLKRLIDLGHRFDLPVMLHCCGGFRELIPDMIDSGLDALHALQPSARGMEPEGLKKDFGKDIVLNGAVDSHHVLIEGGNTDYVAEETKKILDIMMPGGGYIGGASHDSILEETPVENILAMFDTIENFGRY